jgi:hypothetical protein
VRRVEQAVAHVRARVQPEEEALARRLLPGQAFTLFAAMPVADRRHALDVAERLLSAGHDDPDLLAAALLHDAGKGHRVRLWHRAAGVVLAKAAPRLLPRLASPDPRSWRHPFHLFIHHASRSAELATAAGCTPRVAAFIVGDVDGPDARLLASLESADDAS